MKLDLEQSCRALCSIERVETMTDQSLAIIPFSTDAVEVQKLISRKALMPSEANAPKGVTKKDYMNLQQSSEAIKLAQQQVQDLMVSQFVPNDFFTSMTAPPIQQMNLISEDDDDDDDDDDEPSAPGMPEDDMNLMQKDQIRYDLLGNIKAIGSQILSMFKKQEEKETDPEGTIQIEI